MATAPCHDGAAMAGMATHGDPVPENKAIAVHSCMGCLPPVTLLRHAAAVPILPKALPAPTGLVRFDRGLATPPALPPPRGDA